MELMRKREFCYLRSIRNGRDWQERKRYFSNSYKFKRKISNSLILDYKNIFAYLFKEKVMLYLRLCAFAFIFCMCSPMIGNTISLPLMGNVEEVGGRRESQRMPEGQERGCWGYYVIPDSIWSLMQGKSVPKNCTVSRAELRYLKVLHYGKDGKVHQGELICNKSIAQDLLDIFRELYKAKYKIERISLIDNYGADDTRSMEANNTSCFNFRFMTGSTTRISKHGMGLAIDINPLYNPYVKGNKIDPPSGARYAKNRDKRKDIPMKIDRNDLCYKLFIKHGFKWGGAWKSSKDYQHFEK